MKINKNIYLIVIFLFLFTGSSSKNQELPKKKKIIMTDSLDVIQNKINTLDSLLLEIAKNK